MKIKFCLILIFLLTVCCTKKIVQKQLLGSWKRTNPQCINCPNYIQQTTFSIDSLIYEELENGNSSKLTRISCDYKFDPTSNIISYDIGNNQVDLKVLKLSGSKMELLNLKDKEPMKYIRIK